LVFLRKIFEVHVCLEREELGKKIRKTCFQFDALMLLFFVGTVLVLLFES